MCDRAQVHVELAMAVILCTQVRRVAAREVSYAPRPQGVAILLRKIASLHVRYVSTVSGQGE